MESSRGTRGLSRREFVKRSLTAGGVAAIPWIVSSHARGQDGAVAPSERIVLAGIGIGPRGGGVLATMLPQPDVQFVAICDVRADRRTAVKGAADKQYGNNDCATYRDLREMLTREDIDAVLVTTGDRWHALASILAMKAGKDVYSEKPCASDFGQAQALADTAHRYGRVYQAGTQRRSIVNFKIAADLAHSGKLGKLRSLHAACTQPRINNEWLPEEPEPPKDVVDWDLWLGPAPWRPYNHTYVDGGWRGINDFDSGVGLLEWACHTVDLCQWANQADNTIPVEYEPGQGGITGRYANGVEVLMEFLGSPFGNRDPQFGTSRGTCPVRYEGEEGWVETGDSGEIAVSPESLQAELPAYDRMGGTDPGTHTRNFLDCIKSGAPTNANAETTRRSHIACHAAAISWQLGRKLTIDPATETFADDEANKLRFRAMREPWHV